MRYLGIDIDDALAISEQIEICPAQGAERLLCPSGLRNRIGMLHFVTLSGVKQTSLKCRPTSPNDPQRISAANFAAMQSLRSAMC